MKKEKRILFLKNLEECQRITNISTDKLKAGMFIDLSESFLENPFWKDKFVIKSDKEIKKILKAGIKRINIDTNKCNINVEDHDIGKVNIDTNIINKRGKLTVDEFNEIKKHPTESEKIILNMKHLSDTEKQL